MQTIPPIARSVTLKIWPTGPSAGPMFGPRAHLDPLAAAGELECFDPAALLEPPPEGVDHLFAVVTDPLLAQPLPAGKRDVAEIILASPQS
jgi:hypothetical protein